MGQALVDPIQSAVEAGPWWALVDQSVTAPRSSPCLGVPKSMTHKKIANFHVWYHEFYDMKNV